MELLLNMSMESKKDGLFGIEIETETESQSDYPPKFFLGEIAGGWKTPLKNWKAIQDGSLRDWGVEFVLKGPQSPEDTKASLDEFQKYLGDVKFIQNSPSTSVHVHVNMTALTMTQVVNFVMLYSFFENVLLEFSGPTRRSNLFALPIKNCDKSLTSFIKAVIAFNAGACDAFPTNETEWKYSALNFCPFLRHGSFEVRSFRGTTNTNLIWTWVNILKCLVDAAMVGNPQEWLDKIRDYRTDLLDMVFQDKADLLRCPDYKEMLNKNLVYPVLIGSSIPNWDTFENNIDSLCMDVMRKEKNRPKLQTKPWQITPLVMSNGYKVGFTPEQEEALPAWVDQILAELTEGAPEDV